MSSPEPLRRPELTVRSATAADATAISEIYMRSWRAGYEGLVQTAQLEPVAELRAAYDWRGALQDRKSRFAVGFVDGSAAGIAKIGPGPDETVAGPGPDETVGGSWLELLYVVPERWGSGIASELLRWAVLVAEADGASVVRLRVVDSQARARRFYEREGWQYDDDVPPSTNLFFSLLCMRLRLPRSTDREPDTSPGHEPPWLGRRVKISAQPGIEGAVLTPRLRLVPIGPDNAADLMLVHNDEAVVPWYDGWRPSPSEAEIRARRIAVLWRQHGVHKWMAYERETSNVVGRGGLSRTPVNDDWAQCYRFLPDEPWVREKHGSELPFEAHANWLELGWALRREHWGRGFASEIGAAGLAYAFDVLGVQAVVSCTAQHNVRSRAVMERIGMRYAGEIFSRGIAEGEKVVRNDAPFAVGVMLAAERAAGRSG